MKVIKNTGKPDFIKSSKLGVIRNKNYTPAPPAYDPIDDNPTFYWESLGKPLGSLNSFLDRTGSHTLTAVNNINVIDDLGIRALDMTSLDYYKLPLALNSFFTNDHTLVLCVRPNLSVPGSFTTHLGAFTGAGASEHQYGVQVAATGELQILIRESGTLAYGRTDLVGLGAGAFNVAIFTVSQAGGITIRTNGINRTLMPPGPGDGDLSGITLANLNITKEFFFGARNSDGVASQWAVTTNCSLIGYPSVLPESTMAKIENYYAS